MPHESQISPIYSRPPGLGFIHDEMPDGSSRGVLPVTCSPMADILVASVVAVAGDRGLVPLDPAGTDGSQVPAGICVQLFSASGAREVDRRRYPIPVQALTGQAEVIGSRLIWPYGITDEQKTAAVAHLAERGIAVL